MHLKQDMIELNQIVQNCVTKKRAKETKESAANFFILVLPLFQRYFRKAAILDGNLVDRTLYECETCFGRDKTPSNHFCLLKSLETGNE